MENKSWIITVPKVIPWPQYQKELSAVVLGDRILNYRVRAFPKAMRVGDRCYLVHNGRVRGWMIIVGLQKRTEFWQCETTGNTWPPGCYIQRSGPFHAVDGPAMLGFRGVRSYKPEEQLS